MSSLRTLLAAAALLGLSGATAFAAPLSVVNQGEFLGRIRCQLHQQHRRRRRGPRRRPG
ncbi:hypothetical protein ACFQU7_41990 [Pseudoroseomonas wenyumeiae]